MLLEESKDAVVQDKYFLTHILFYAMGMLSLLPSNFFITANDYWMYKFRNINETYKSSENRTSLQAEFTSSYSIVSSVSVIFFLIITIATVKRISLMKRLLASLSGILCMFVITVIFVETDTDSWQRGFFVLTLIIGVFLTGSCGVFMVSLFQLASKFPPEYLATILSGQAICGIFAALVQILAISIGAASITTGFIYFLVGLFFVFLTLVSLLINLKKSNFFKYNFYKNNDKVEKIQVTKHLLKTVFGNIVIYIFCMALTMGPTIMIYPGVASLVVSANKGSGHAWNDLYFVPVVTFLMYHCFDYIGRELALKIKKPSSSITILIISAIRLIFLPLIMYCNTKPRRHMPVIFEDDAYYICFIIIFAFSHGYILNLCVMAIITRSKPEERGIANVFVLVIMIISMGLCSFVSAALVKLL